MERLPAGGRDERLSPNGMMSLRPRWRLLIYLIEPSLIVTGSTIWTDVQVSASTNEASLEAIRRCNEMEFIGQILSEPDPPGISKQRWVDLIREHPNLENVPPRQGINPFTREPMLYHARTDTARVVIGEREVGSMSWSQGESNSIDVSGERHVVVPLAHDIAGLLDARFEETCLDGKD